MKMGHVKGTKKERTSKSANWWYQTPEAEAMIQQMEAEWAAKQAEQKQN